MSTALVPPRADPFLAREQVLGAMAAYLRRCREEGRPCLMYVHGLEGLGVSCLVTQFSLEHRRLIDGPLIWLAGRQADGQAVPVGELLGQALWAFGGADSDQAGSDAIRANAYQRICRGRRFMLVVDDLASTGQIEQLVPSDAPQAVIAATAPLERRGLQTVGFRPFTPEFLPQDAAGQLFRHALGEETADRLDESTTHELVERCGGFPLLVKVMAAQIAGRPRIATRLLAGFREARLDLLSLDDERRMTRFLDVTYQQLTPRHAEFYRRAAVLPGPEFAAATVAAALDADPDETAAVLDDLVDYNLLTFTEPDRYRFHPIIRDDARSRAETHDDPRTRTDIATRALRWFLREALARGAAVSGRWWVRPVHQMLQRLWGEEAPEYSRADALRWFGVEAPNLVAGIRIAHRLGLHDVAWPMSVALWKYLHIHGLYDAWIDSHRAGLASARAVDDPAGVLQLSSQLGAAYLAVGEYEPARRCFDESLDVARSLGDLLAEQSGLEWLGKVAAAEGEYRLALQFYRQSWDVVETGGDLDPDQRERAAALLRLQQARALVALEDWPAAETDALAATDYFDSRDRETDNRGKARLALGRALLGAGDGGRAVSVLREAVALFEQEGAVGLRAEAHCLLGDALTVVGQRDLAVGAYRQAMECYERVGSWRADAVGTKLADLGGQR